jgi:hypothetical protein
MKQQEISVNFWPIADDYGLSFGTNSMKNYGNHFTFHATLFS